MSDMETKNARITSTHLRFEDHNLVTLEELRSDYENLRRDCENLRKDCENLRRDYIEYLAAYEKSRRKPLLIRFWEWVAK